MKKIPITTYKENPDGKLVTTLSVMRTCAENTPQGGLDLTQIRARSKVLDVIEKAENEKAVEVEMEDDIFETLKTCLKETRWVKPEKHLISFAELFGC